MRYQLEYLDNEYTNEEVHKAIMQLPKNKESGPDGFPIEFYQQLWDIIGEDFMIIIKGTHTGRWDLRGINRAAISLIQKKEQATVIGDFRPISVINTSVKIITKAMAVRLQSVLPSLVSNRQTAFVKGRSIMESFLVAREFLSACTRKKFRRFCIRWISKRLSTRSVGAFSLTC